MRNNKRGYLRSFMIAGILSLSCFIVLLSCKKDDKNPVNTNPDEAICKDIDGNTYRTVKIGNQVWMAENLKVTRYRNGDKIPNVTDGSAWAGLSTGARCAYNNSESTANTYGYLYNWHAVNDSRNIVPPG